jgi:outer membrane immunogenic protein
MPNAGSVNYQLNAERGGEMRVTASLLVAFSTAQLLVSSLPARAQSPSNEKLAQRLATLERQMAELRSEKAQLLRAQQTQLTASPHQVHSAEPAGAGLYASVPPQQGTGSWTGFYLGANLGLSIARSPTVRSDFFAGSPQDVSSDRLNLSPFGAVGGFQGGYNWQIDRHWLVGVEADFQGSSENQTVCIYDCTFPGVAFFSRNMIVSQRLDWLATVRGRAGWTYGPVLFYGTGGLAVGEVNTDISLSDFNFGKAISASASVPATKLGWTAGFGGEMQIFGNWTGKIEYLYVDLGNVGAADFTEAFLPPLDIEMQHINTSFRDHIVRVGLNYKFGDPIYAPVTAGPMYYKAPPVVAYSWEGPYVGANVGVGIARNPTAIPTNDIDNTAGTIFPVAAAEQFTLSPFGIIGGIQAGYNWQAAPHWIIGVETDFQGSGQEDTVCLQCGFLNDPGVVTGAVGTELRQRIDWFGTLRGRAGWTNGPVLYYATGGLAYGHVSTDETVNTIPFTTGVTTAASFAQTKVGWTAGAGAEAHLFGNWTAKAEYLYVDLGQVNGNVIAPTIVIPLNINPFNVNQSENRAFSSSIHDHIFRVGLNYRVAP